MKNIHCIKSCSKNEWVRRFWDTLYKHIHGRYQTHSLKDFSKENFLIHMQTFLWTNTTLLFVFIQVDDNSNGELEFDEFVLIMAKIMRQLQQESAISSSSNSSVCSAEEELTEAFRCIDRDRRGIITKAKMKKFIERLGEKLSETEIDEMMELADKDNDGVINFRDFEQMMKDTVTD